MWTTLKSVLTSKKSLVFTSDTSTDWSISVSVRMLISPWKGPRRKHKHKLSLCLCLCACFAFVFTCFCLGFCLCLRRVGFHLTQSSYACACACVASENQAYRFLNFIFQSWIPEYFARDKGLKRRANLKETDKIWYCTAPLGKKYLRHINDYSFLGVKTLPAVNRKDGYYQNTYKPN